MREIAVRYDRGMVSTPRIDQGATRTGAGRWVHWKAPLIWATAVALLATAGCDKDGGDDAADAGEPVPNVDYCDAVADWDAGMAAVEVEVLELVNLRRSEGANCGGESFGPAASLTMNGALRCAARAHSLDMFERGFFDHTNPDGEGPGARIDKTEYQYSTWGENIAAGYPTAEAVMNGWMESPGHCSNIMNPNFTEIGVGYHDSAHWTQVFGRPAGG